ncbi:MAG: hypothetical protein IPJ53_18355 [Saprospiraceae bacterium]|nr:hypothetical protein [Candidatus Vicinibacter affinis]
MSLYFAIGLFSGILLAWFKSWLKEFLEKMDEYDPWNQYLKFYKMAQSRVKKKRRKRSKSPSMANATQRKKFDRNAKRAGMSLTDYFVERCC